MEGCDWRKGWVCGPLRWSSVVSWTLGFVGVGAQGGVVELFASLLRSSMLSTRRKDSMTRFCKPFGPVS